MKRYIFTVLALVFSIIIISGCAVQGKKIVNELAIQPYLFEDNQKKTEDITKNNIEVTFWSDRLLLHPGDSFFKQMCAGFLEARFRQNGNIDDLVKADSLLVEADKEYKHKEVSILQSLAQISISRHRFKMALEYSKLAYTIPEARFTSALILTDALIETGNYSEAAMLLDRYKDENSLPYLIRESRLLEQKSNLEEAIAMVNKAHSIALSDNNLTMICYTDNLLGTYLLENNMPEEAYKVYLEALSYNPHHIAAIEGIAAISLIYDNNAELAGNIYESLRRVTNSPETDLNLYKIARVKNDSEKKTEYLNSFLAKASDPRYGRMYNKYIINIEAEEFRNFTRAKEIAESEITERPTPAAYFLLAWAYYNGGDTKRSIDIIKKEVEGKTADPDILAKIDKIFLEETKKM